MLTCIVCGCKFNAVIERHYISKDPEKTGLATVFGAEMEPRIYDTFDCPQCGCQLNVQERKRPYIPYKEEEDDE